MTWIVHISFNVLAEEGKFFSVFGTDVTVGGPNSTLSMIVRFVKILLRISFQHLEQMLPLVDLVQNF